MTYINARIMDVPLSSFVHNGLPAHADYHIYIMRIIHISVVTGLIAEALLVLLFIVTL